MNNANNKNNSRPSPPTPTASAPSSPTHKRRRTDLPPPDLPLPPTPSSSSPTPPSSPPLQQQQQKKNKPTSPTSSLRNAVRAALAQESSPTARSTRLKQVYDRFRLRAIDNARAKTNSNHNNNTITSTMSASTMVQQQQQSDNNNVNHTSNINCNTQQKTITTNNNNNNNNNSSSNNKNNNSRQGCNVSSTSTTSATPSPSSSPSCCNHEHANSHAHSSNCTHTRRRRHSLTQNHCHGHSHGHAHSCAHTYNKTSPCSVPAHTDNNAHTHTNTQQHDDDDNNNNNNANSTSTSSTATIRTTHTHGAPYREAAPGAFPGKGARPGCDHYERGCWIKAACCGNYYACRRCHDEHETHEIDRHATELVACVHCGDTDQPVADSCRTCHQKFARYFCGVCNFYDDRPGHDAYHCDGCGICRVGKGLGIDNYHCNRCGNCVPIDAKESHPCRERSLDSNCPICTHHLATSTEQVVFLPCGHCMHVDCLNQHTASGFYTCPMCHKAITDMSDWYRALDVRLAQDVMPEEYVNRMSTILCHDCDVRNDVPFHFVYHKCPRCNGYNTRVLAKFDRQAPPTTTTRTTGADQTAVVGTEQATAAPAETAQ